MDPNNSTWCEVTDDITAVVLINNEISPPEIENHQTSDYLRTKFREFYTDTLEEAEESYEKTYDTFNQSSNPNGIPVQKRIAPYVNLDQTADEMTSEEQETEKKTRFSLFVKNKKSKRREWAPKDRGVNL